MFDFITMLNEYVAAVWGPAVWVLLLVLLDFLLGVIGAVMERKFTFSKLADFLATNVLLKVAGAIVFTFIMHIGSYLPGAFLPDEIYIYTPTVVFGILVLNIVLGSIVPHLATLGIIPENANRFLERAGVNKKE